MRTKTMVRALLLLLCTITIAVATTPCDQSLIKGAAPPEIIIYPKNEYFDLAAGCRYDEESNQAPKMIIFNSKHYDYVSCDSNGWSGIPILVGEGLGTPELLMVAANSSLNIDCGEYCSTRAESGVNVRYRLSKLKVTCADIAFDLFSEGEKVHRNEVWCSSIENGWVTSSNPRIEKVLSTDIFSPRQFECRKAPPTCSFPPVNGLHLDPETDKLSCSGGANSLQAIEFNSARYESLSCVKRNPKIRRSDVWKAEGKIITETSPIIAAACVEYCIAKGEGLKFDKKDGWLGIKCADAGLNLFYNDRLVISPGLSCSLSGWTQGEYTFATDVVTPFQLECKKPTECPVPLIEGILYDKQTKKVTCEGVDKSFPVVHVRLQNAYVIRGKTYEFLECDPEKGLKAGDEDLTKKSIFLECMKLCATKGDGIAVKKQASQLEITCTDQTQQLWYSGDRVKKDVAKCDFVSGWPKEIDVFGDHSRTIEFECKPAPPSCSLRQDYDGSHFDTVSKRLSCPIDRTDFRTEMRAILFNGKRYLSLTCDDNQGWKAGDEKIAEADAPLEFSCVQYCEVWSLSTEVVPSYIRNTSVHVNCSNSDFKLFRNFEIVGGNATCTLDRWQSDEGLITTDTSRKMPLDCLLVTTTTLAPSTTTTKLPATTTTTIMVPDTTPTDESHDEEENREPPKQAEAQNLPLIIGGSIGALAAIAIIAAIIIFMLLSAKKRAGHNADKSKRNDEILNEVDDVPSDI